MPVEKKRILVYHNAQHRRIYLQHEPNLRVPLQAAGCCAAAAAPANGVMLLW